MPSNHLILCRPLLLLPSVFPSIRVFSKESALHFWWPKYWSFNFSISSSISIQGWFPLGLTGLILEWVAIPFSRGANPGLLHWQADSLPSEPPESPQNMLSATIWRQRYSSLWGFPDGSVVKNTPAQRKRRKRCRFDPWGGKIPWRRKWQPTPVFFPRKSYGQGTLATVHRVTKESEMT